MNSLKFLLKDIEVSNFPENKMEINGVTNDSRKVKQGSVFIAINGFQDDGKKYIKDAISKGASIIISEKSIKKTKVNIPVIEVNDIRKSMSKISSNYYNNPSKKLTVIGITGTNGKTTTSFILNSIIKSSKQKSGVIGTLGAISDKINLKTNLTTPDSLELHNILSKFVKNDIEFSIIEVSSHALSLDRVNDVDFDMAVFTNISHEHLDFHTSMENYISVKSKLFSKLKKNGFSIINKDDKKWKIINDCTDSKVRTFSVDKESADIRFIDWGISIDGIIGKVKTKNEIINVDSPLIGYFNLENILCAIACAVELNISKNSIEEGIKKLEKIPGRLEKIKLKNNSIVIIDYAHSPDAYKKLFSSLIKLIPKKSRIGILFGCGGGRDIDKRSIMASYVELYADMIFVAPDNPREESQKKINNDIKKGLKKKNHIFFEDRKLAIYDGVNWLNPNDVLLIIGKGAEKYQIIGNEKIYHSDLETVNNFIDGKYKYEN